MAVKSTAKGLAILLGLVWILNACSMQLARKEF